MHSFVLHHCSKFQTILITFQGVTFKKPPRSTVKWYFLLVRKLLKEKTREMYVRCELNLHDICTISTPFIFQKMKVSRRNRYAGGGGRGPYKKPSKNDMKLTKFRL